MSQKNKYTIISIAALALLSGGIYLGLKIGSRDNDIAGNETHAPSVSHEEIERIRDIPKPKAPIESRTENPKVDTAGINALSQLNNANTDPQIDIRVIEHLLNQVHTVFHELPTGEHDEIVAFLRGANPRNIQYIADDDPNLNEDGKIIDRWGTPYFFHALSRHRIEVRSAGPDQLHWSDDDIISEKQES